MNVKDELENEWLKLLNSHLHKDKDFDINNTFRLVGDLYDIFIGVADIKNDSFKNNGFHYNDLIVDLHFQSNKTKSHYSWNLVTDYLPHEFNYSFELSYSIGVNSIHIKKLSDEYWFNLLRLKEIGDVSFINNICYLKDKDEAFYKNEKSSIFKIISNYMLLTKYAPKKSEWDNNFDFENFGQIEISWNLNLPFTELLFKVSRALKLFIAMDHELFELSNK